MPAQLAELPAEAQECRLRRHAWPRSTNPAHEGLITFEPTKLFRGRVVEGTQRMVCTGNCGTIRKEELYRGGDGRMHRAKKPTYKWTKPYRLVREDPDTPVERIDPDDLLNVALRLSFPEHKW